ncbi:MAG: Lipopolysaccharide biosynthesis protein, partial [Pedosphaera sp.]|nr:Lipopolysaccharide biosynthesis protein [Pedosphaera sp.]
MSDIYYVLFRHKWKISVLSICGLIGAGVIFFTRPTLYISSAEILIKAIHENNSVVINNPEAQTQQVASGPDGLIYSEMAILGSFDLALRVATNVGPETILAKYGGGSNYMAAANL